MPATPESTSPPNVPRSALPARGDIFDGKFQIDGVLGLDGMGALLVATRLGRDERVAIKVLLPDLAGEPALFQHATPGFASSKLRPDFVRAAEAGIFEGRPYLVIECPAGSDPRALVDQGGIHRSRPPAPVFPPPTAIARSARERLAPNGRASAEEASARVSSVPMRSAIPGYLLAGMAIVAIVATAGWAVWHQSRALHQAEARTDAPTLAPQNKLPSGPPVPAPPPIDSAVTTTSAFVSRSTPPTVPPASASPAAAAPLVPHTPRHHSRVSPVHPPRVPPARPAAAVQAASASDAYSPYQSPPAASPDPGAGTDLFEIRK